MTQKQLDKKIRKFDKGFRKLLKKYPCFISSDNDNTMLIDFANNAEYLDSIRYFYDRKYGKNSSISKDYILKKQNGESLKTTPKYQIVNYFPEWFGFNFHRITDSHLSKTYKWYLHLGFICIRRYNND